MLLAPIRLVVRILLLVIAGLLVYGLVTLAQIWLTSREYDARHAQAIVVMGSAQYDGVPSPDLRARLDQAVQLFHRGDAGVVVVTGAGERGDRFTEAQAGAAYLTSHGVPSNDVFQAGGHDSYGNLSGAASLLKARGDLTVLVVTDPFHEYRSMAIATDVGLRPYPAPTRASPISGWSTLPYFLKETGDVGLGRVIGYRRLSQLHAGVG